MSISRNIKRIVVGAIIILSFNSTVILSNPIDVVEGRLNDIGVEEEYINAISTHLKELELVEADIEKINENLDYVLENTEGKTKVTDCTLPQLYNLYNKGMEIAKGFDLKLSMNFLNKELSIKSSNGDTLFSGEFDEIEKLYKNYLILGYKKEEDMQYIVESFRYDENLNAIVIAGINEGKVNDNNEVEVSNSELVEDTYIAEKQIENYEEINIANNISESEYNEIIDINSEVLAESIDGIIEIEKDDLGKVIKSNIIFESSIVVIIIILMIIYIIKLKINNI